MNMVITPSMLLKNSVLNDSFNNFILTTIKYYIINFLNYKFYLTQTVYIQFLINNIYFYNNTYITNIYNYDTIYKKTIIIQLRLPSIIYNFKQILFTNYICYEIPYILNNSTIINGIKRNLISKLSYKKGLFLTSYNINTTIYNLQIFNKQHYIDLHLDININTYEIFLFFKTYKLKFNFIHCLYLLNISNKHILQYSKYSKTNLLKSLLQYNTYLWTLNFKTYYTNPSIQFIYNIFKYYFLFLEDSSLSYYTKFLLTSFILFLDLLIDISLNKYNFKFNYIYTYTTIYNIFNDFTIIFPIFLSKLFKYIKQLYIHNNIIIQNTFNLTKFYNNSFLSHELLLINPLLRNIEDINLLSEIISINKLILHYTTLNTYSNNLLLRDFKQNQIGFFCLFDTPEGPSSGLILSLTINTYLNYTNILTQFSYTLPNFPTYSSPTTIITTLQSIEHYPITYTIPIIKKNNIFNTYILTLQHATLTHKPINKNSLLIYNLYSLISLGELLIPFLLHNDPTRCLMGSKMQAQSVPLLFKNNSLLLTGNEFIIPFLSMNLNIALQDGVVIYVSSYKIIVKDILNREISYFLPIYKLTNSKILYLEKPLVWVGERIKIGQLLSNNNNIKNTELTLGTPVSIIYGTYFGFDYEDSLIISQNIIYNNIFLSLHLNIYEYSLNINTPSEILDINSMNILDYTTKHLNIYGLVKEGSKVMEGDILLSKVKKLNITIPNKLIHKIFGPSYSKIINTSYIISKGLNGRIIKLETILKGQNNNLSVYIRIFIGKLRNIILGDKLSGRHGNKGIVSYISKSVDLPYLLSGETPDIILGSLSIPSRMNLGQLYESLFSLGAKFLDKRFIMNYHINTEIGINYIKTLLYNILKELSYKTSFKCIYNTYNPGKLILRDGKIGTCLKGGLVFGYTNIYKLIHMVTDKVNFRTIGGYSDIIQQPLQGREKNGGQRFGEMEVWALEAYGASYNIKELLNYRSDDIKGRKLLAQMLIQGKDTINHSSISESFKVILHELHGLTININMFNIYPKFKNLLLKTNIYSND